MRESSYPTLAHKPPIRSETTPTSSPDVGTNISKNFTLRLVRRVRLTHRAHQAQIAVQDASLRAHFVRTRTLPIRAPQTPPGAPDAPGRQPPRTLHLLSALDFCWCLILLLFIF